MNRIATADSSTRGSGFQQAAARLNLQAAIVEKDFWVCWMLGLLFGPDGWGEALVFKGGTALSKVFGVLRRFSEDLDLSVSPQVLGIEESLVKEAGSRRQRDRWMEEMEKKCCAWVEQDVQPALEARVEAILGKSPSGKGGWLDYERDATTHSPVLYFNYPCEFPEGTSYIRRQVKLEFGSLTDQHPTGRHRVSPWLVEVLSGEMKEMGCEVMALEMERAFWEKATIFHAEYHREADSPMPERYSRHYADVAAMARRSEALSAIRNEVLRDQVAEWKALFFARSWARYDLAKPGTFRLLPPDHRLSELRRDYQAMSDMFLDPPPSFDEVLAILEETERLINRIP
jgi:hypothetical protein